MPTAQLFSDLEAWQLCMQMSDEIFGMTDTGPVTRHQEFCEQIRAAADKSAPLIAEGFVRFTTPEFVRYLRMARGEIAEVLSQLERAKRRNYLTPTQLEQVCTTATRAMAVTTALLRAKLRELEKRKSKRARHARRG